MWHISKIWNNKESLSFCRISNWVVRDNATDLADFKKLSLEVAKIIL